MFRSGKWRGDCCEDEAFHVHHSSWIKPENVSRWNERLLIERFFLPLLAPPLYHHLHHKWDQANSGRRERKRVWARKKAPRTKEMALRMWASSTANALKLSSAVSKTHLSPALFSLSRCFSSGLSLSLSLWLGLCYALRLFFLYVFPLLVGLVNVWFFGYSAVLEGLKYAKSHEWVKHEGRVATIGITDHAQVPTSSSPCSLSSSFFFFCLNPSFLTIWNDYARWKITLCCQKLLLC